MNITFRLAEKKDLRKVKEYTTQTAWRTFTDDERKALKKEEWIKNFEEMFERLVKRETDGIFIAEDQSKVFLGYVWVGEGGNMMTGLKHGYIYDIFVKEESRGKGIGKSLLEKAESYCREKHYSKILLMVSVNNVAAMRLYDEMGFKAEQTYMGKKLN